MIRRLLAALFVIALIALALPVMAWTLEDCVEVNFDHPDCDQYTTTTTTGEVTTTTAEVTTTTAEVTTTTEGNGTTTTVNTNTPPATTPTPATTIPFDSVPTTVPESTTGPTQPTTTIRVTVEELPSTGISAKVAALGSSIILAGGLVLLALSKRNRIN